VILTRLEPLIRGEEAIMGDAPSATIGAEAERRLAADLFNRVWTLLEAPARTDAEDDEMLHAAHASRFHWGEVGEPRHRARGEWQCSRVYATLGRPEPALHHARRCLDICLAQRDAMEDFDEPFAHEALARAHALAGDAGPARDHLARARELAVRIADEDDRQLVESDLEGIPVTP
jgi:hypothetical protein